KPSQDNMTEVVKLNMERLRSETNTVNLLEHLRRKARKLFPNGFSSSLMNRQYNFIRFIYLFQYVAGVAVLLTKTSDAPRHQCETICTHGLFTIIVELYGETADKIQ